MNVGKALSAMTGVKDAAVVMGTKENRGILERSGLLLDLFADTGDADLLIAVKAESDAIAEEVLSSVDRMLAESRKTDDSTGETKPWSVDGALNILPNANLALISVAGRYAGGVARDALDRGMHVMLFSDNVSIEDERSLKEAGREKGLLVMGPDCGTAIINGVPLAFANVVNKGPVGIVAASGTGLQEVSVLISNAGSGISQAIGTGGRDVKEAIGGIMFIEALKALATDEQTRVILLVSKPPHPDVLAAIEKVIADIDVPVVSCFLGAESGAATLEEAALTAVALANGDDPALVTQTIQARNEKLAAQALELAAKRRPGQKYVRGLYSGGTFCTEAQLLFSDLLTDLYSNAPAGNAQPLADNLQSQANTVVDLGEDEFTVGRPHPMIEFTLRNQRIRQEADDPQTAVILLDVVLGYGSNMDPAGELKDVITDACGKVQVVCSITGTPGDPQDRKQVEQVLTRAGALVMPSNAAACMLAAYIIREQGE
jgi:succinyl-CoA synthetase alpha subunit